jgi:hypothetical protein
MKNNDYKAGWVGLFTLDLPYVRDAYFCSDVGERIGEFLSTDEVKLFDRYVSNTFLECVDERAVMEEDDAKRFISEALQREEKDINKHFARKKVGKVLTKYLWIDDIGIPLTPFKKDIGSFGRLALAVYDHPHELFSHDRIKYLDYSDFLTFIDFWFNMLWAERIARCRKDN